MRQFLRVDLGEKSPMKGKTLKRHNRFIQLPPWTRSGCVDFWNNSGDHCKAHLFHILLRTLLLPRRSPRCRHQAFWFSICRSKLWYFFDPKSDFSRFQAVWRAKLVIRTHFGCIMTSFDAQNALKSVSKFWKNRESKRLAATVGMCTGMIPELDFKPLFSQICSIRERGNEY